MVEASFLSGIKKHTEPPSGADRLLSRQSHQLRGAHDAAAAKRRLDCNQNVAVNGNGNVALDARNECSDGQSIWVIVIEVVGGILVACITVGCCKKYYCKKE